MKQRTVLGCADVDLIQRMALSRNGLMVLQATARTPSHDSFAGGMSHGGEGLHPTLGTSGGNGADGAGALGPDRAEGAE